MRSIRARARRCPPPIRRRIMDCILDRAAEAGVGTIGIRVLAGGALSGREERNPLGARGGRADRLGRELRQGRRAGAPARRDGAGRACHQPHRDGDALCHREPRSSRPPRSGLPISTSSRPRSAPSRWDRSRPRRSRDCGSCRLDFSAKRDKFGRRNTRERMHMAKAYWVATYRSISDPDKLAAYAKLAGPAIQAAGGKFLARGNSGQDLRGRAEPALRRDRVRQRRSGDRGARLARLQGGARCARQRRGARHPHHGRRVGRAVAAP